MFRAALLLFTLSVVPPALAEAVHVRNTTPAQPPRTVHLEEVWRIGGAESDILFGTVTEAVVDPQGNVYLLDNQLNHVEVISPAGEHVATLGREGDGPGEVRVARDVVFLEDGTIGIASLFPSQLVRLTPDGEPRPTLHMGGDGDPASGFYVTIGCEVRGGTLLFAGHRSTPHELGQYRQLFLSRMTAAGKEAARFCETEMIVNFQTGEFVERELIPAFFLTHAIGPNGRIYAPRSRDLYVIDVYNPDGTLERVIEREFDNRPRTPRERRRLEAIFGSAARQIPREVSLVIEPANPVIAGLFVDANGNLWVKHSRSGDERPAGVLQTYDLFDPDGRYLQKVSIACEGDPLYDDLEFLTDGRVLLVKGHVLAFWSAFDFGTVDWDDEEDVSPPEVICYRMR